MMAMVRSLRYSALVVKQNVDTAEFTKDYWNDKGWTCLKVGHGYDQTCLACDWLVQMGFKRSSDWEYIRYRLFAFRDARLAMLFKLRWGGK